MRRWIGAVVALALVSCDLLSGAKAKPPAGPVGDVARAVSDLLAPGANVSDARFDSFLADIDLAKTFGARAAEIGDQIKEARASATKSKSSSGPAGSRLASLGAVFGESLTIEFAKTLADSLDEFTKVSTSRDFPPKAPTPHVSDGATSVTTSSISQTETLSSTGPQVKLTLNWSYRETTKDKSNGAILVDIAEDRTMVGSINICPDPQGAVGGFVDVKDQFKGLANGQTTTLTATTGSVFTGYVDDSAALQNVYQTLQDKQSWESASGSGSYEATFAASSQADASGSTSGGIDISSASGAFSASDAAAAVRSAKAAAWSFVLNGHSLAESYQSAQKLWRNGRCVVITAPDYSAKTPLNISDQDKAQNDKAVDPSSETKFSVGLEGRFGGLISASTNATLMSGTKTIAPNKLDGGSGSLTYKAPDEDGKKATLQLKSTSKRGIGTLVLDFHTGQPLTITISGTLKLERRFIGTLTQVTDTVAIGPVEFKKTFGDTWEGTGVWQASTSSFVSAAGATQTCTGSQRGTITMLATLEDRAGNKVWVVDPLDAMTDGTATSSCQGEINIEAGSAEQFLGLFRPFVFPQEGGTIAIHGASGNPSLGSAMSDGTATAKTTR